MSYKYTKEAFRKLINMDDFTVEFTSSPIDIQELSNLGIDGLNERCVDDVVDQGYLIEDITLTADSIVDGEVVVKITGHAETWLAEAFPEEEKSDEPDEE